MTKKNGISGFQVYLSTNNSSSIKPNISWQIQTNSPWQEFQPKI